MYFNSNTYVTTIHKPREQNDDGVWGATSPPQEMGAAQSGLGTFDRAVLLGVGMYAGAQIYSGVTNNVKSLTGSSLKQEQVKNATFIAGSTLAAIKTKGLSLVFQGVSSGVNYFIRDQVNRIENIARQEEMAMLGDVLGFGVGSAYYD
jgi:hypothetical protein